MDPEINLFINKIHIYSRWDFWKEWARNPVHGTPNQLYSVINL